MLGHEPSALFVQHQRIIQLMRTCACGRLQNNAHGVVAPAHMHRRQGSSLVALQPCCSLVALQPRRART